MAKGRKNTARPYFLPRRKFILKIRQEIISLKKFAHITRHPIPKRKFFFINFPHRKISCRKNYFSSKIRTSGTHFGKRILKISIKERLRKTYQWKNKQTAGEARIDLITHIRIGSYLFEGLGLTPLKGSRKIAGYTILKEKLRETYI